MAISASTTSPGLAAYATDWSCLAEYWFTMRTGTRRLVAGNGCGALSGWICTSGRGLSAVADGAVGTADAVDSAGADTAEASDATGAWWGPLITGVVLSLTTSLSFLTRRQSGPPPRSL